MPAEDLAPVINLFRHRFLHALREAKLISPKELAHLHNQGGNVSTKTGVPWTLAWHGGFESESAAIDFERYLKTASGKAFARKRLLHT